MPISQSGPMGQFPKAWLRRPDDLATDTRAGERARDLARCFHMTRATGEDCFCSKPASATGLTKSFFFFCRNQDKTNQVRRPSTLARSLWKSWESNMWSSGCLAAQQLSRQPRYRWKHLERLKGRWSMQSGQFAASKAIFKFAPETLDSPDFPGKGRTGSQNQAILREKRRCRKFSRRNRLSS